ncbi:AAA-ATPase At2g46620-like [Nymphaea colorata]|uniref:AAA+ ATPase domain-containing protein n=1 Tax=Nymphaea colorata TaxID=210225 RepID=A0A5K1CQE5_9MAGN|nr:AAA-ATPase At2g46620-like [Nymphaea colorata]
MASGDVFLFLFCCLQTLIISVLLFFLIRRRRGEDERSRFYQCYRIPEFDGDGLRENGLYRRVSVYINSLPAAEDSELANLYTPRNSTEMTLRLEANRSVEDSFLGAKMWWKNEEDGQGNRSFVLSVRRKDKSGLLRPYLQHVQAVADEITSQRKELRIFSNSGKRWRSAPFRHPATFETVAMEPEVKKGLKSDLESFAKGRQYFHRVGRTWKRGYLFYGVSGTGKSTTIAAMANLLGYDLYVMELSHIADDSELKILLQQISGRTILVVEDLDDFFPGIVGEDPDGGRTTGVTISGLLNMMDGIWSCCEEQRIMVLTMGSKDGIDPTVLRPGRLDVHIHFPVCTFPAFKTLASNYLGVKDHKLFTHVEEHLQTGASLTPAEIGEIMIVNRSSPSRALKSVINALQSSSRPARKSDNVHPSENFAVLPDSSHSFNSLSEFRKLYKFLRTKSQRKPPQLSFDHSKES